MNKKNILVGQSGGPTAVINGSLYGVICEGARHSDAIGCGICVKNCQHDAVKVENFHAVIDPEKCVGCGACMEKCPKKCIVKA